MAQTTEEPSALTERVVALDIGKAALTACLRVPDEDKPGARRQEVRTYATLTPLLLELRDWLVCQGVTPQVEQAEGHRPRFCRNRFIRPSRRSQYLWRVLNRYTG